ncbi:hypothetical protein [Nocardia sp. NBC_00511]|uniref:hypothetical protein n=1 Tax=Nocardia sp. NBC_00511 TaxID=2903591 RepID=UPI0030DFAF24
MTAPSLRDAMTGAGTLLFTSLLLGAGVVAMSVPMVSLGRISVDQFVGMLLAGVAVAAEGVVAVGLRLAWFYLMWPRRNRRMRDYALYVAQNSSKPSHSLDGYPQLPVVEGRTSPVDAAGNPPPVHPDSSTPTRLDLYRKGPWPPH